MQSLDYSVHRFLIFFFSSIFPYPGKQSDLCILLLNLNLSFKIMYLYSNLNNISKILYFHHIFYYYYDCKKRK